MQRVSNNRQYDLHTYEHLRQVVEGDILRILQQQYCCNKCGVGAKN